MYFCIPSTISTPERIRVAAISVITSADATIDRMIATSATNTMVEMGGGEFTGGDDSGEFTGGDDSGNIGEWYSFLKLNVLYV
jgi:hypothetical protein